MHNSMKFFTIFMCTLLCLSSFSLCTITPNNSIRSLTKALHKINIEGLISNGILGIQSEQRLSTCISVSLTQAITEKILCWLSLERSRAAPISNIYNRSFIYFFKSLLSNWQMNTASLPVVGVLYF